MPSRLIIPIWDFIKKQGFTVALCLSLSLWFGYKNENSDRSQKVDLKEMKLDLQDLRKKFDTYILNDNRDLRQAIQENNELLKDIKLYLNSKKYQP